MGKNPRDDTDGEKKSEVDGSSRNQMKKILHSEMIDRGILLDKEKKKKPKRRVSLYLIAYESYDMIHIFLLFSFIKNCPYFAPNT